MSLETTLCIYICTFQPIAYRLLYIFCPHIILRKLWIPTQLDTLFCTFHYALFFFNNNCITIQRRKFHGFVQCSTQFRCSRFFSTAKTRIFVIGTRFISWHVAGLGGELSWAEHVTRLLFPSSFVSVFDVNEANSSPLTSPHFQDKTLPY